MNHQTTEHIHVNQWGEYDEGCICGDADFYTVIKQEGVWVEVEPVIQWEGYACIGCNRIYNENGLMIAHPKEVMFTA